MYLIRNVTILLLLKLLLAVALCADSFWTPPWDLYRETEVSLLNKVVPTAGNAIYDCYDLKVFEVDEDVAGFVASARVLNQEKLPDGRSRIRFIDSFDLSELENYNSTKVWKEEWRYYSLWKALRMNYAHRNYIQDGVYYRVQSVSYSEAKIQEYVGQGTIFRNKVKKVRNDDSVYYRAEIHTPIDLVAEAAKIYETVRFTYENFVVNGEDSYNPTRNSVFYTPRYSDDLVRIPGEGVKLFMGEDRGTFGASLQFFVPEANGHRMDHHILRNFMMKDGCRVAEYQPGVYVYVAPNNRVGAWPTVDGNYVLFGARSHLVMSDMLEKHPSSLTKDSIVNRDQWFKNEVAFLVEEMLRIAEKDTYDAKQSDYLRFYHILNRIMGTIEGAPLFEYTYKMSPEEFKYHASIIDAWWNHGRAKYTIRERFLSRGESIKKVFEDRDREENDALNKQFRERAIEFNDMK